MSASGIMLVQLLCTWGRTYCSWNETETALQIAPSRFHHELSLTLQKLLESTMSYDLLYSTHICVIILILVLKYPQIKIKAVTRKAATHRGQDTLLHLKGDTLREDTRRAAHTRPGDTPNRDTHHPHKDIRATEQDMVRWVNIIILC